MGLESSREIDGLAAAWVARIDRGPLSAADEAQLAHWLDGDSRRRGAFMRLRAIALHTERAAAFGPHFDPDRFKATEPVDCDASAASLPLVSRRRALWLTGSAIAASGVAALGIRTLWNAPRYDTRTGEIKVVPLEDGSVMSLNTQTNAVVEFDAQRRMIALDRGEALFDVAKNPARPFIVRAGDTQVRAVGTSFTVKQRDDASVEVVVREGVVEVRRDAARTPVTMTANTRLVVPPALPLPEAPQPISLDEVERELAWKSGQLAFEGESLTAAAAAFARYSDTRIILADPSVGREEITGLFTANDPVSFARAAAASLDLKVKVEGGTVTLSR